MLAGTASATLVGLLFVSLSLHLRIVLARQEVRAMSRATLSNFGLVLLVALFVVIPQDAGGLGVELEVAGAVTLALIAVPAIAAVTSSTQTIPPWLLLLRFGLSGLAYAGTVASGVLLARGSDTAAFACLAASVVILLIVSLRNSWDLLVSVGGAVMTRPTGSGHADELQAEVDV